MNEDENELLISSNIKFINKFHSDLVIPNILSDINNKQNPKENDNIHRNILQYHYRPGFSNKIIYSIIFGSLIAFIIIYNIIKIIISKPTKFQF